MTVSAIVSAYYAERFLTRRLANLAAQSRVPEVVVVCKAGSAEEDIARHFFEENSPAKMVIVITPDIPGIYKAWNIGILVSTGTFITNANSDDLLRPRALEEMENQLHRSPRYAAVYGNQEIVRSVDGPVVGNFEWAEGGLKELLSIGCFLGPQPMWRRSLHEKYGWFDETLQVAGDYEFWLRLAAAGERFMHIRAVVGTYMEREDGAERRQKLRTTWETSRLRAKYRSGGTVEELAPTTVTPAPVTLRADTSNVTTGELQKPREMPTTKSAERRKK